MSQDTLHTVGKPNLDKNIAAYPRWQDTPEMNAFWSRPSHQGGGDIVGFWQNRVWAKSTSGTGMIYAFDGRTWYVAATIAGDNIMKVWFLERSTVPTVIVYARNDAANVWTLEKFTLATDGTLTADGGNPVLTINSEIGGFGGAGLGRAIVECGTDEVVYVEYGHRMYGSSDAGGTWATLLTSYYAAADNRALYHFHGGHYDVDNAMLYIFTGDAAKESTILLCDDVPDLLLGDGAWSTDWRLKWGLEDAARSTMDEGYVLNDNLTGTVPDDMAYRTVDARKMTDEDGNEWLVWGVDCTEVGGTRFWRQAMPTSLPLAASRAKYQVGGQVPGIAWYGTTLEGGTLLFGTYSHYDTGSYGASSDEYVRLIAIRPDAKDWDLLRRWRRGDWESPGTDADDAIEHLVEVYGHIILQANVTGAVGAGLEILGEHTAWGRVIEAPNRAANTPNRWTDELASALPTEQMCNLISAGAWTEGDTEPSTLWAALNLDGASGIDTSVKRTPGQYATLKLVGDGTNTYSKRARQYLGGVAAGAIERVTRQLIGRWVTLRTAIKLPASGDAPGIAMRPGVYFAAAGGGGIGGIRFSEADFDGAWHEITTTRLVLPGVNYLYVELEASVTGSDPSGTPLPAVYFDDVSIVAGHRPGGRNLTDISLITTQRA